MSALSVMLKQSLKDYLIGLGYEVSEVTHFEEYTYQGGGCETCAYEQQEVLIRYRPIGWQEYDREESYCYIGTFTELLNALISA